MIDVVVNGGSTNQRKYAKSMAYFCINKFLPRHKNLNVEINLKKMSKDTSYGYCCHLEGRDFELDIKRTLSLRDLITTVAHEMVHVKQYVLGEMPEDITEGDYWDMPHEIEAHGREVGLFIRWAEKNRLSHLKWTQIS